MVTEKLRGGYQSMLSLVHAEFVLNERKGCRRYHQVCDCRWHEGARENYSRFGDHLTRYRVYVVSQSYRDEL